MERSEGDRGGRVQWIDENWEQGWGLGFSVYRFKGKTYIGHGGSLRGYRTDLRMSLADKIAVISFTNVDDGDPTQYHEKVFDWVAPAIRKAVAPPAAVLPCWRRGGSCPSASTPSAWRPPTAMAFRRARRLRDGSFRPRHAHAARGDVR